MKKISKKYNKPNNKYLKPYDQKQELKQVIYLRLVYMVMRCLRSGFKWIGPKEFDVNKYTSNNSKVLALDVDLRYPKQLCGLHNEYPLAPDKIEIKRKMLPSYQSKIAEFYKIPIGNVKN